MRRRISGMLLIGILMHLSLFSQTSAAQPTARFTLNGSYTIETIFKKIKESKLAIFYAGKIIDESVKVKINVTDAPLDELLSATFKNSNIAWIVEDKAISFYKREPLKIQSKSKDTIPEISIMGYVKDIDGRILPGASVISGKRSGVSSSGDGSYTLNLVLGNPVVFSYTGYESKTITPTSSGVYNVSLTPKATEITAITVYSNGYQTIPKERSTGSFEQINNQLLNRSTSSNILSRLEGIVAGVAFNKNISSKSNESEISIRSRSTILGNPKPLIVLDNFPYSGDISTINPNDIENITILKDAASASIWGTLSGNGVIVISTKSGRTNQAPKLSFNSNITVSEKVDLHTLPRLSSESYIDYEKFMFSNKYYASAENNTTAPVLSPAVEILIKLRDGVLTQEQANEQLSMLSHNDIVSQQEKYFYRPAVLQQYSLGVSGGGNSHNYYVSMGYDKSIDGVVKNGNERITLLAKNSFNLLSDKLKIGIGVNFTKRNTKNAGIESFVTPYPYLDLGTIESPKSILMSYRQRYIDTAGQGLLLDWRYLPLQELGINSSKIGQNDYRVDISLDYQIIPGLQFIGMLQYNNGLSNNDKKMSQNSFQARDLVNQYTQINYGTRQVTRNIPVGDIIDRVNSNYQSYNLRGQLTFNKLFADRHEVNALTGIEQRDGNSNTFFRRLYGVDPNSGVETRVDLFKDFPILNTGSLRKIVYPYTTESYYTTDRYRSYFINASYRFDRRYSISGSARKDESNIFGVKTNQRGVPLFSAGIAWDISNEQFYNFKSVPYLKFRATYGYSGNVDNTLSAYTITSIGATNFFNSPTLNISNPPNPMLRWEKSGILNLGLDFSALNNILSGSIEYYNKNAKDLLSNTPFDPTSGVSNLKTNAANMRGNGWDVTIKAEIGKRDFRWNSTYILSTAKDKVTNYSLSLSGINQVLGAAMNPIEGHAVYSLYAYQWMGLDSLGGPTIILDGKRSNSYTDAYISTSLKNVKYIGRINPLIFGSLINGFAYKKVSVSFNITYKLGYYFRKPSLQYYSILQNGIGSIDGEYKSRWMQPGDEAKTNVPSRVYPENSFRDLTYFRSDINVRKGDHIRLQDIRVEYPVSFGVGAKSLELRFYGYANNLGILWRSNREGIDPDFVSALQLPRMYTIGFSTNF